jgi:CPA2 family monovalent cation:H+ antiporter-2
MTQPANHLDQIRDLARTTLGCAECLNIGDNWVRLRRCLTCGHVGCCDDSRNRHASLHFRETGHLVVETLESAEIWRFMNEAQSAEELEQANENRTEGPL